MSDFDWSRSRKMDLPWNHTVCVSKPKDDAAHVDVVIVSHINGQDRSENEITHYGDLCSSGKIEDAIPELEGFIKWDECANLQTSKECMLHLCGHHDFVLLAQSVKVAYTMAAEEMGEICDFEPPGIEKLLKEYETE